ncbi:hypothetical protein OHB12_16300 [Nocardia sp. NBC_01730]|nr:hypothetical protein OHB12_16300 [Nocardia sp. NBC_01730]
MTDRRRAAAYAAERDGVVSMASAADTSAGGSRARQPVRLTTLL